MARTMTVDLGDELREFIESLIESGDYRTQSEVIRESLRLLLVVTCYDPDAPTGSGWWHWVVVNLPADTRVLPQGFGSGLVAMPDGVLQTRTDFGKTGYDGAAPPKGETHRYIFTVHALDIERIDVDEGASGAMVGFNVHFHSLASASITAMFS